MRYLHTMVRVTDIEASKRFFCDALGLEEVRRVESEKGRFTLVFLAAPGNHDAQIEMTYNWDLEKYAAAATSATWHTRWTTSTPRVAGWWENGVTINRPPRDGRMAFIRSPDDISVELLQKGDALPPREPWASMQNIGKW